MAELTLLYEDILYPVFVVGYFLRVVFLSFELIIQWEDE